MLEKQQQILQAEQGDIDRLVTEQEAFQDAVTLLFASQGYPFTTLHCPTSRNSHRAVNLQPSDTSPNVPVVLLV